MQLQTNYYQRLNDRKKELFLKKGADSFFTKEALKELQEIEVELLKPKIEDKWRQKKEFKD